MPRLLPQNLEAVRTRVEDVAQRLFIKQGYAATTMREIAEAAGLTAGGIYVHFPSKEAIFAAVVERYRNVLAGDENPLHEVMAKTDFPFDLPQLADAIEKLVSRHRPYWLLWYVDVLEFEGKHFRSALAPQAVIELPALKRRFAELSRKKILRVKPETGFLMAYMHLFNYFLIETIFGGNNHYGVPRAQAIDVIVDVFLQGMLARGVRS